MRIVIPYGSEDPEGQYLPDVLGICTAGVGQ